MYTLIKTDSKQAINQECIESKDIYSRIDDILKELDGISLDLRKENFSFSVKDLDDDIIEIKNGEPLILSLQIGKFFVKYEIFYPPKSLH